MTKNFTEAVNMTIRLVVIFLLIFGASSCADYDFIDEMESNNTPEEPGFVGDTLIRMDEFNLHHGEWETSDGLLKADHYFDGYIKYMVDDKVVKTTLIDHENAPMRIEWEAIAETTDSIAVKKYLGCEAKDARLVESHQNQEIAFSQYKRECKLSFEGMEVTLTGSWYEASLGTAEKYCRYDSTTIASQHSNFEMVDGEKVTVEKDGQKYNRLVVTADAVNHFTDMPSQKAHQEQMDIVYTVLVPVGTEPEPTPEPEPEDKFLGFDKKIVEGNNDQPAQIIITEHWSVSGDKEIVFTQSANYSFAVSGQQRVFGETLNFVSGPTKSTNSGNFNKVKENQFVRTITDTYTAKFNLCDVKATASYNEAYVEYRNEKINFEFAKAEVSYEGINNPTATEVEADGKLFSRKAYEVSFSHNLLGEKKASVLVDQEIAQNPDTPDEWGDLDVEKTIAYGRIGWSWRNEGGIAVPFVTLTVVTEYGIVSAWEGGECFTKFDTNTITGELGNAIFTKGETYLIPSYISIPTVPNKHWVYTDINGKKRDSVAGSDILLLEDVTIDEPFIADGGEVVTNAAYEINGKHVKVTYRGKVLFEHTFPGVVK